MANQYVTAKTPTEIAPDLLDLLGLPGPPGTRNAAPVGPRNGVAVDKEVRQLQANTYHETDDFLALPISPLDAPIAVTHFADATAKRQTRVTTTFRQLAARIESERAPAKADLPWLKLATFGDLTTFKGALRHDANLVNVTGVEGDYDAGEVSPDEAVARLRAANLAGIIYTTPTHTPAAPRWRALCPTSSPMTPADRDAMCDRLNAALGGILARESFARSQSYYFGATGDGRDHRVHLVDGRPIDKATELHKVATPDPVTEADDDDFDLESLIAPDFERIGAALAFIPADDRNDWLLVGMALHSESKASDAGFDVWSEWSRASEKFDAKNQRAIWDSFGRRPGKRVTIGSLYSLAKANGWNAKAASARSRLTFLTPSECQGTPSRGYVVKGILAPGDVGCIFGAPGAGKSLIAPHIGYAVAQGRAAFGMRSKPGRVFYVAAEDPHGMRGRVTALKMRHDDAADFTLVEGVSDLLSTDSPDLEALKAAVESQRPALIFLDTLAMAFPGLEENSAEAMGRVVAVARSLAQWDAAVVLIHHDTKAEGKTPRGHSLLNGALDMAMHVSRDDVGVVRAKLTKNRNGSCDRDLAFLIDTRVLGEDEDGDAITAALVEELASGSAPRAEKLTDSASAALAILTGLEADKPDNATCPGVLECDWRDACVAGRAVSGSENPESRAKAFRRASRELAGQGRTFIRGDVVRSVNPATAVLAAFSDGIDD